MKNLTILKLVAVISVLAYTVGHSARAADLNSLIPNTIAPEIEHMSHATQHAPFTNRPTKYGAEIVQVTVTWNLPHDIYIAMSEGISLDRHYNDNNSNGEIMGPREQFTLRIGKTFSLK